MLPYFHPHQVGAMTLSIDKIVLDFHISDSRACSRITKQIFDMKLREVEKVETWKESKCGRFSDNYRLRISEEKHFWLGAGLNGSSTDWKRWRMEFNPNKVANEPALQEVLRLLLASDRPMLRRVARFDLAIDLPVPRKDVFLVKDRRLYIARRHGEEFTEYLGAKSSQVGRVKLYNKAAESELSSPLTRLELTLDPKMPFEDIGFPKVHVIEKTMLPKTVRVTDTERFIINAVLQGCGSITDLGRKTRAKIEQLLEHCTKRVSITPEDYEEVRAIVNGFLDGSLFEKKVN